MTKFCVYQIIIQVASDIICHHFDQNDINHRQFGLFDKSKILLSNFTLIFAQLLNKCFNIWIKRLFAYIKEILKNNPKFFCKFTIIKKLGLDKKSSLQMVKNI